jgi:hypothetical protein
MRAAFTTPHRQWALRRWRASRRPRATTLRVVTDPVLCVDTGDRGDSCPEISERNKFIRAICSDFFVLFFFSQLIYCFSPWYGGHENSSRVHTEVGYSGFVLLVDAPSLLFLPIHNGCGLSINLFLQG